MTKSPCDNTNYYYIYIKLIIMSYRKEIKEFAKVRMEQTPNNTQIARDIINKFGLDKELETVRWFVRRERKRLNIEARMSKAKRLFFDIETSYHTVRMWRVGKVGWVGADNIIEHKKIICISYKWQHEDKVHTLDWTMGEKQMLKAFVKIMKEADECVYHNGDRFDIKEIRTRCIFHGVLMYPNYRSLDTLKKSRQYFNFASNKLDYIGTYLNTGNKLEHEGFDLWVKVVEKKDKDALKRMREYCEQDVILLEDTYFVLSPYITHNNNFAVLSGGEKWHCPTCSSKNVKMFRYYATPLGVIRREMRCNDCKQQYKVSNKTYLDMLVKETTHEED